MAATTRVRVHKGLSGSAGQDPQSSVMAFARSLLLAGERASEDSAARATAAWKTFEGARSEQPRKGDSSACGASRLTLCNRPCFLVPAAVGLALCSGALALTNLEACLSQAGLSSIKSMLAISGVNINNNAVRARLGSEISWAAFKQREPPVPRICCGRPTTMPPCDAGPNDDCGAIGRSSGSLLRERRYHTGVVHRVLQRDARRCALRRVARSRN